ncbi:hypothetical protein RKD54_000701 [Pseudarthrobacter sp. SLBN-100]
MTAVALLIVPESFDNPYRSATILAGCLILLWVPTLHVPRGLHRITALLASASLHIYVTHWLVYPLVDPVDKGLAVLASLACGVLYWMLATRAMGFVEKWVKARRLQSRAAPLPLKQRFSAAPAFRASLFRAAPHAFPLPAGRRRALLPGCFPRLRTPRRVRRRVPAQNLWAPGSNWGGANGTSSPRRAALEAVAGRAGLAGAHLLRFPRLHYPADDGGEQSKQQFLHVPILWFGGSFSGSTSALADHGWLSAARTSL